MERALLVTVKLNSDRDSWPPEDASQELRELVLSTSGEVVKELICKRDKPTPNYYLGKGKVQELTQICENNNIDVVIFNDDLSGTQQRNLEEALGIKTVDRTQLILDIFAQHAFSLEGKMQVELAQLEYLLPRLTGKGIALSRLGGGIGTRGPGEKKLEVDRRRVARRITKLKRDLANLIAHRERLRKRRQEEAIPLIAIVGYTNAGKTTLLNALTAANQAVKNTLFSTLEPVARRYLLSNNQVVLFSDTVGFLHKLPHHLIEAFKATLEEVVEADLLLHVLDASHPLAYEQNRAVKKVLTQLGAADKPFITVLNKVDRIQNKAVLGRLMRDFSESIPISALKAEGLDELIYRITVLFSDLFSYVKVLIPQRKMNLLNLIYEKGRVFKRVDSLEGIYIEAQISKRLREELEKEL